MILPRNTLRNSLLHNNEITIYNTLYNNILHNNNIIIKLIT